MNFDNAIAKVAEAARTSPVVVVGVHGSGKVELARRAAEAIWPEKPASINVTVMDAVIQYPLIRDSQLFMLEYSRLAAVNPAKSLGKKVRLRDGWNDKRILFMERVLEAKFRDPELRALLLATEDAELVEGNTWNDTFWGVCKGNGRNELGKALMRLRDKISQG